LDRSTVGRLVGMFTAGARTLNPCGGATETYLGSWGRPTTFGGLGFRASLGGGGNSFFGGGGSVFFISTKLTLVSTFSAFREPARAVAKTARKTISECNIMLKMVPPTDRPFLSGLFDSSSRIIG